MLTRDTMDGDPISHHRGKKEAGVHKKEPTRGIGANKKTSEVLGLHMWWEEEVDRGRPIGVIAVKKNELNVNNLWNSFTITTQRRLSTNVGTASNQILHVPAPVGRGAYVCRYIPCPVFGLVRYLAMLPHLLFGWRADRLVFWRSALPFRAGGPSKHRVETAQIAAKR